MWRPSDTNVAHALTIGNPVFAGRKKGAETRAPIAFLAVFARHGVTETPSAFV
jgi:hypothetical protein